MVENVHSFVAIRGIQAGGEFYTAMVPLGAVVKLFQFDEPDLPAELRAQRTLNKARVPEIARYLVGNPRGYVLPALTASADGKVRFEPLAEAGQAKHVGQLVIPMSARLLINDGQHRRAAIESALRERPGLGDETIAICLFIDAGLKRSQQMFSDLNRHVVRPSPSLTVLYDHRDVMAELTRRVVNRISVFKSLTEHEKGSITGRRDRLFTLNGLHRSVRRLTAGIPRAKAEGQTEETIVAFWTAVVEQIRDWKLAAEKRANCADLRRDFIHAHGVALEALGIAGCALLTAHPEDWKSGVGKLRGVDWSREAKDIWEGVALVEGRVSKAHTHLTRTADYLKGVFGLDDSRQPVVF
jgi:DNA sulfur modification protein DndB